MDKSAIRNFAIEARKILMKSAITEAGFYGITKDGCKSPIQKGQDFEVYETLAGTENRIFGSDIKRRTNLVRAIEEQGFEQVIEETAYTWFNRIIAIRFMEVNDYLPTRVRVLSSETGSNTPDIVTQSLDVDLNMTPEELGKVQSAKDNNKYDEAFRLLFIKQCNELNGILPGLFEKTDDYMELLLKLSYTGDGVVRMLIDTVQEDNFNVETEGQVEIIGWMYQYYNTELKDDTFAKLKKNVKISKERIPAATQLFTPDWIVRYMVENSVGRIWIEHLRANDSTIDEKAKAEEFGWKYYLPEAEQEPDVQAQLVEARKSYKDLTPMDITCIDPCMGSGHILVYMFDVLMDIYRSEGYNERDSVFDILEKNIHGLDIDRRAYQLSYFALMMKARGYNRRFFRNTVLITPMVFSIEESNLVNREHIKYFGINSTRKKECESQLMGLLDTLLDAKEFGSILNIQRYDWPSLREFSGEYDLDGQISFNTLGIEDTKQKLLCLINQAEVMTRKYYVISTNPPYMGCRKGMNPVLKKYVEKNYVKSKSDLYACFIEKCSKQICEKGICAMITQQSFMFTDDYKELRSRLLDEISFISMAHLGADAFPEINGEVVQTTAYVFKHSNEEKQYRGCFSRLLNYSCDDKPKEFLNKNNIFYCNNEVLQNVKATPISYWLSDMMRKTFDMGVPFEKYGNPRAGITTGDNDSFLRVWFEVDINKIGFSYESIDEFHTTKMLYIPYNKGGEKVKWYGNRDYVIMFDEENYNKLSNQGNHLPSRQYYMKECITWSDISGRSFAARYCPQGSVFDVKGSCGFPKKNNLYLSLALLNCCLTPLYIDSLNPTTTTQVGDLKRIPVIDISDDKKNEINKLAEACVDIVRKDWNLDEKSWEFSTNELLHGDSVQESYEQYSRECLARYEKLMCYEKRINEIFIEAYNLKSEVTADVNLTEIKIRKPNRKKAIISLISYAVGCMVGRFSINKKGIYYAGSTWDKSMCDSFIDEDGVIPITDEEYFKDDIVSRFIEFIKISYGEEKLESNLIYVADSLDIKGETSRQKLRNYFIKDFFKDHCSTYSVNGAGKRPIYWLFDSGNENGFKCLIYMHRYTPDIVGIIRSEYLHRTQDAIERALKNAEYVISSSTNATDKARAMKIKDKYVKQINELRIYYQAISHIAIQRIQINLDDGVKANYSKFQGIEVSNEGTKKQTIDLLAKI